MVPIVIFFISNKKLSKKKMSNVNYHNVRLYYSFNPVFKNNYNN